MKTVTRVAIQGAACGFAFGITLLVGQHVLDRSPFAAQAAVRGRRFCLIDKDGNERAVLGLDDQGRTMLELRDSSKTARAKLVADDKSGALQLLDTGGNVQVELQARDFVSGLRIQDPEGKLRVTVLQAFGTPSIGLLNSEGTEGVGITVLRNGFASIRLAGPQGKKRAELSVATDGSPSLALFDSAEKSRAVLGSVTLVRQGIGEEIKRPESSLVFFNADGKVIWSAP